MAWRWCARLIGVVSTAILARLLTPADFGVYAMAMLALQVVEIFSDTGQDLALIRLGKPSREHYDTAWTVQVILNMFLAACMLASAPLAGLYFHSEAVESLAYFLALRLVLNGFLNVSVVAFRIELDFAKDFRYGVYRKFLVAVVGVLCVLLLRNYWGLGLAVVLAKLIDVIVSYIMRPFRPHFRLTKFHEIWSLTFWMQIVQVSSYFVGKVDEFIVGSTNSAGVMGAYNVAADVALSPTTEVVQPIMRALFPLYSKLLADPERLRAAVLMAFGSTASVCFATGPGVASIAKELVPVLLGSQWHDAIPLVFWHGIGSTSIGLSYCLYTILSVTNNARLTAITVWCRGVLLVPTLLLAAHWGGAVAIAAAVAYIGFVVVGLDIYLMKRIITLRLQDIVLCLYRPAIAASLMVLALFWLDASIQLPVLASMIVKIACGGFVYLSSLLILWHLAGRADGIEAIAVATAARIIRSRVRWSI